MSFSIVQYVPIQVGVIVKATVYDMAAKITRHLIQLHVTSDVYITFGFLDMYLNHVLKSFASRLDQCDSQLRCFNQHEMQVEGWFKGELLSLLNEKQDAGEIHSLQREAALRVDGRNRKVDIYFERDEVNGTKKEVWLELKHWHIGKQNNTYYGAPWYFKNKQSTCIYGDVEKLKHLQSDTTYILVLATHNPGIQEWEEGIAIFNSKYAPLKVESLTKPYDYPDNYFLGLLRI